MKLFVPIKKDTNESKDSYITKCNLFLHVFKQILQSKLQQNKLLCRQEDLFNEPNIKWRIDKSDYNILLIANTFINQLQCVYDNQDEICYYTVPIGILCPYTSTSLIKVIRILEYGGYNLMPLNWIRSSYRQFVESTTINNNKNN